jgi:subtilisin-like proprotein convertase family protein
LTTTTPNITTHFPFFAPGLCLTEVDIKFAVKQISVLFIFESSDIFFRTAVGSHEIDIDITECKNGSIKYLEHVEVSFSLNYTARGYLAAKLTSPSGTTSEIIPGRRRDTKETQFVWSVMSVHFWGERGEGKWKVVFSDAFSDLKGEGRWSLKKI